MSLKFGRVPGRFRFVRLRYAPPHFATPAWGTISLIQLLQSIYTKN